jgi:hypothetical protein
MISVGDTYGKEAPVFLKDHHDKGRKDKGATEDDGAHFPGNLTLARAGDHPLHDGQDVEGGKYVEDLEEKIPHVGLTEDVEVSGAEDDGIEDLGDEGDALSAAVAVDGRDKDELGEEMGAISQDTEKLYAEQTLEGDDQTGSRREGSATYVPGAHGDGSARLEALITAGATRRDQG